MVAVVQVDLAARILTLNTGTPRDTLVQAVAGSPFFGVYEAGNYSGLPAG